LKKTIHSKLWHLPIATVSIRACQLQIAVSRIQTIQLYIKIIRFFFTLDTLQHVSLYGIDDVTGERVVLIDTLKNKGSHKIDIPINDDNSFSYSYRFSSDSINAIINIGILRQDNTVIRKIDETEKHSIVMRVFDELAMTEYKPVEDRLESAQIDSVIKVNLDQFGIDMEYVFGVFSPDGLTSLKNSNDYANELAASEYVSSLFPNALSLPRDRLALYFPDQNLFMLRQVGLPIAAIVILIVIIVGCFTFTVKTIMSQKTFARLLVDFINNMTHEFKTPLSSIALASEAIKKPEITADQEKILRYNRMIEDENYRMRNQVDKILQMAALEEGDYELDLRAVDVHEAINKSLSQFDLLLKSRDGKAVLNFKAGRFTTRADADHFGNILNNIIDNAIKYSPKRPHINIETENIDDRLIVKIKDSGVGIEEKQQRHIFNKYYRVPSGNRHDVKGFGLGLSYVKLMITAFSGVVSVTSEPGKGTAIELSLPVSKAE